MRSPYGIEITERCLTCKTKTDGYFCSLEPHTAEAFEAINHQSVYPKGALLFVEGQSPRGAFILCKGRAKLSTCSRDGKTLIMQIAEPGEVLGLSAVISGEPYEVTAETLVPCQVSFIKREDFLKLLLSNGEACLKVARLLSSNYHTAYEQIRSLGLSNSCAEKLAKLLLEWTIKGGEETQNGIRLKLGITHEEIAQMIGTSRETVTRLFGEFRSKQIINIKGSTLVICDRTALEQMVA